MKIQVEHTIKVQMVQVTKLSTRRKCIMASFLQGFHGRRRIIIALLQLLPIPKAVTKLVCILIMSSALLISGSLRNIRKSTLERK